MPYIASDETKLIPAERWMGWFDTFTNGNRGRLVSIKVVSDVDGAPGITDIVEDVELVALDYDPAGKGNIFTLSYGDDENPLRHSVENPTALWQGQDEDGVVDALEIESANGIHTVISLF